MHAFEKKYHWEWYRKWKKKYHNTDVPYWKNQNKWLLCIFPTDSLFVSLSLTYQFFTLQNLYHEMNYMVQFVILEFSSCLNAYEKHDSCLNAYENTFHLHVVIYLVIHCMYMMNVFIRWMYFTNIHESTTQTPQSLTFLMWQCLFTAEIFVLVPHYLHQESCLSQLLEIS